MRRGARALARWRRLIEESDWDERLLRCAPLLDAVCWVVIAAALACLFPVVLRMAAGLG
jgi:hypothetical protein